MRELFQSRRQRSASARTPQSTIIHDLAIEEPHMTTTSGSTPHRTTSTPHRTTSAPHLPPVHQQYQQQHYYQHQLNPQLPPHPRQNSQQSSTNPQHRRRRVPPPPATSRTRGTTRSITRARSPAASHHSRGAINSNQSTATMSVTSGTVTVPTYVPASVSRFSDDETSWMSGVESQTRSVGGGSSKASSSKASGRNPYLRDGKKIKRVIEDLARAADPEAMLTALSLVCVEFDHNDTIKHNAELYYGAIAILAQKLSMTDHHDHECIRLICGAIEMAFRGGTKYVKEAFHVNAPSVMPPLLRLLDRCEQSKVKFPDEIILNITKTFHYWSRIPELRLSLARQPGLLDCLRRVANSPLNTPSRNVRVRVIANLANCNDNKSLMYAHKGLLSGLLKIAQLDPFDATREYATIALMDLASAPANQVPLASNGNVLKVLATMAVSEKITSIRESATTTLQTLAYPKSNRLRLVNFQDGLVMDALLKVLQLDSNEKARRRAGGALTNLASDATAGQMARHPGLLATLAQVAVQDNADEEVQSRACLALTKIASSINWHSPFYPAVMDALVAAADARIDNNISAVFRLRAREAECRESMARHPGLMSKLAGMCFKPSLKDRDNATRAIMHLANENVNRKIMCNDEILEALIQSASCNAVEQAEDSGHTMAEHQAMITEMQDSAIRSIARLATEFSNRQIMAKHQGLITTIARATERESKLEMKGAVNHEQQQAFLGKPLLMSLLMAM